MACLLCRSRILAALLLAMGVPASGLALAAPAAASVTNGPIIFVSGRSGNADVWRMDADGADPQQLTNDAGDDVDPAPSPNGSRIAFVSNRDGNGEIYVMDADGSDQTRLTDTSESEAQPSWSPDGTRLVFVRGNTSDIWTMDADGTDALQVTAEIELDNSPVFSPDGATIAFSRSAKIWTTDIDGENQTQITSGANDLEPAFLPDGRILYRATNQVFVMDADGSNPTNLSNDPVFAGQPAASPDGQRVAFLSLRNTVGDLEFDIYVMDVDGSDQTNLTADFANDYLPAWSAVPPVGSGPTTSFTAQPASIGNDATPTFVFEANEPSTYECSLVASGQPDDLAPCSSPVEPSLDDGTYVFKVRATDADLNVESPPRSVTFTVDTQAPAPTIEGSASTADNTPSFTFSFGESATPACAVTAPAGIPSFATCASPFTVEGALADGPHVLHVRGTDAAGNVGTQTFAFTVDTSAPSASITGASATNDRTPTFTFTWNELILLSSCSVVPVGTPDAFVPCVLSFTSPSSLADGSYVFKVRGTDLLGTSGTTAFPFTVDATAPSASISGPTITTDNTPSFTFSFDEAPASGTVLCSVHAPGVIGSFGACSSPFDVPALPDGDYVLEVKGTDTLGNVGAAAAHAFTIDATAPPVSLTAPTLTNDRTPSFTFSTTGATLACSLTTAGGSGSFSACASPFTAPSSLADGAYVFTVRATDAAGNVGEASGAFLIDGTPPVITVTAMSKKTDRTPTFSFTVPDVVGGFTCAVDAGAFAPCTSPFTTAKLKPAKHTLKVRGSDAAGNETTKTFPFKIKRP